jgi:hypothetical protein
MMEDRIRNDLETIVKEFNRVVLFIKGGISFGSFTKYHRPSQNFHERNSIQIQ